MTKFRRTHSREIDGKRHVWNVERLWILAEGMPVTTVAVSSIGAIDEDCWFSGIAPSIREVVGHCRRIVEAELNRPIILHADGALMDGGHRVARALLEGVESLPAVRFKEGPEPDVIEAVEG